MTATKIETINSVRGIANQISVAIRCQQKRESDFIPILILVSSSTILKLGRDPNTLNGYRFYGCKGEILAAFSFYNRNTEANSYLGISDADFSANDAEKTAYSLLCSVNQWRMQRSVSWSKIWSLEVSRATLIVSPARDVEREETRAIILVSPILR